MWSSKPEVLNTGHSNSVQFVVRLNKTAQEQEVKGKGKGGSSIVTRTRTRAVMCLFPDSWPLLCWWQAAGQRKHTQKHRGLARRRPKLSSTRGRGTNLVIGADVRASALHWMLIRISNDLPHINPELPDWRKPSEKKEEKKKRTSRGAEVLGVCDVQSGNIENGSPISGASPASVCQAGAARHTPSWRRLSLNPNTASGASRREPPPPPPSHSGFLTDSLPCSKCVSAAAASRCPLVSARLQKGCAVSMLGHPHQKALAFRQTLFSGRMRH